MRIVDARWRGDGSGPEHYRRDHMQGAAHLDWRDDLNHSVRNINDLLLPPDKFAEVWRAMVSAMVPVVVAYADQDYSWPHASGGLYAFMVMSKQRNSTADLTNRPLKIGKSARNFAF